MRKKKKETKERFTAPFYFTIQQMKLNSDLTKLLNASMKIYVTRETPTDY